MSRRAGRSAANRPIDSLTDTMAAVLQEAVEILSVLADTGKLSKHTPRANPYAPAAVAQRVIAEAKKSNADAQAKAAKSARSAAAEIARLNRIAENRLAKISPAAGIPVFKSNPSKPTPPKGKPQRGSTPRLPGIKTNQIGRVRSSGMARNKPGKRRGVIRRRPAQSRGAIAPIAKSDACLYEYSASVINPWAGVAVCMPTSPGVDSAKTQAVSRGTITIGSGGDGFIYGSNTFDETAVLYYSSASTFAGTAFAVSGTGVSSATSDSPYTAADFLSSGTTARTVSMGIRVRYSGAEQDRGGTIYLYTDAAHASQTSVTFAAHDAKRDTVRLPVRRAWSQLIWFPSLLTDRAYTNTSATNPSLAVHIRSTGGVTFDYEWVHNMEVTGPIVISRTPSYVSPYAETVLARISASHPLLASAGGNANQLWGYIKDWLLDLPTAAGVASLTAPAREIPCESARTTS